MEENRLTRDAKVSHSSSPSEGSKGSNPISAIHDGETRNTPSAPVTEVTAPDNNSDDDDDFFCSRLLHTDLGEIPLFSGLFGKNDHYSLADPSGMETAIVNPAAETNTVVKTSEKKKSSALVGGDSAPLIFRPKSRGHLCDGEIRISPRG